MYIIKTKRSLDTLCLAIPKTPEYALTSSLTYAVRVFVEKINLALAFDEGYETWEKIEDVQSTTSPDFSYINLHNSRMLTKKFLNSENESWHSYIALQLLRKVFLGSTVDVLPGLLSRDHE